MIELVLAGMLVFGVGTFAGKHSAQSTLATTPDEWQPAEHAKAMKTCRLMCGRNRVLLYDAISSTCKCKSTKR